MSIKSKVLSAAAALTLVGGVGAAGVLGTAGPASAGTPSCGHRCINTYNLQFGRSFLVDVYRQGNRVNQPIILFRASNADPALDFTVDTIADYSTTPPTPYEVYQIAAIDATFFPPAVVLRYYYDYVYEIQYSPYGVDSGLCVGVAATPTNGEAVTLQNCGVSADTFWIADAHHHFHAYAPLVNAASANFTQPYVLTYPANGYPTDMPRPELYLHTLQRFSTGQVYSNQLWSFYFGVVH